MASRDFNSVVSGASQNIRRSSFVIGRDMAVNQSAYINEIKELGGIRPQDIITIHKCDAYNSATYGTLVSQNSVITIATESADGPVNNSNTGSCVKLTMGASADRVILTNSASPVFPKSFVGKKYIGFWYTTSASGFAAGDLKLELWSNGNSSDTSDLNTYYSVNIPATGNANGLWKYMLVDISGAPESVLKNVTQLSIKDSGANTGDILYMYLLEAFYWAYNDAVQSTTNTYSGPARGLIMELQVTPGSTAIAAGDSLIYDEVGNVKVASSTVDGALFAGVALEAADASATYNGSVTVKFVTDGIVHRKSTDVVKAFHTVQINTGDNVQKTTLANIFFAIGVAQSPLHGCAANDVIPVLLRQTSYGYTH